MFFTTTIDDKSAQDGLDYKLNYFKRKYYKDFLLNFQTTEDNPVQQVPLRLELIQNKLNEIALIASSDMAYYIKTSRKPMTEKRIRKIVVKLLEVIYPSLNVNLDEVYNLLTDQLGNWIYGNVHQSNFQLQTNVTIPFFFNHNGIEYFGSVIPQKQNVEYNAIGILIKAKVGSPEFVEPTIYLYKYHEQIGHDCQISNVIVEHLKKKFDMDVDLAKIHSAFIRGKEAVTQALEKQEERSQIPESEKVYLSSTMCPPETEVVTTQNRPDQEEMSSHNFFFKGKRGCFTVSLADKTNYSVSFHITEEEDNHFILTYRVSTCKADGPLSRKIEIKHPIIYETMTYTADTKFDHILSITRLLSAYFKREFDLNLDFTYIQLKVTEAIKSAI